jgi:transposase
MPDLSIDLRRKLVAAYKAGRSGTYTMTAVLFGVGRATVSRALRRQRETGDQRYRPKGGNNPRRVDLDWLRKQCEARPDDRIVDRIKALEQQSGEVVSYGAMWGALHAIGWSFKKKRP